jgi:hypothetical protein
MFATDLSHIKDRFEIGPNPTKGDLFIKAKSGNSILHLVIIDSKGKKLIEQNNTAGQSSAKLNMEHLPDGFYFLLLNDYTIKISKVGNP